MAHTALPAPHTKPRTRKGLAEHLHALGALVDGTSPDPTRIFDHGLALLVQHLGVDRAIICRTTDLGREVFWWVTADGMAPNLAIEERVNEFCPMVLDHPKGVLAFRDAQREESGNTTRAAQRLGIRGYLGVSLSLSGPVIGVLSLECGRARAFNREDIALVKAVAGVFEKILELEQLKHDLRLTKDALDLTQAVVEDSLLESPASHLPNARFLSIWTKTSLFLARRSGEPMALARWSMPPTPASLPALQAVAKALRGEDLLVDLGKAEFLLLLPRTDQAGADVLLGQVRKTLGPIPMGATLWNPGHPLDRNDLNLNDALRRTKVALQWSCEATQNGIVDKMGDLRQLLLEEFGVSWELVEAKAGDMIVNSHRRGTPSMSLEPGGDQDQGRFRPAADGPSTAVPSTAPRPTAPPRTESRGHLGSNRLPVFGFRMAVPGFRKAKHL